MHIHWYLYLISFFIPTIAAAIGFIWAHLFTKPGTCFSNYNLYKFSPLFRGFFPTNIHMYTIRGPYTKYTLLYITLSPIDRLYFFFFTFWTFKYPSLRPTTLSLIHIHGPNHGHTLRVYPYVYIPFIFQTVTIFSYQRKTINEQKKMFFFCFTSFKMCTARKSVEIKWYREKENRWKLFHNIFEVNFKLFNNIQNTQNIKFNRKKKYNDVSYITVLYLVSLLVWMIHKLRFYNI